MTEGPKRLVDLDPGFARLVAASDVERPAQARIDEVLSQASVAAVAPRAISSRWLATGIAVGLAGLSAIAVGTMTTRSSSVAGTIEPAPHTMAAPGAVTSEAPAEAPVLTVSVEDLAAAPADRAPAARSKARATTVGMPAGLDVAPAGSTFDEELALVSAARSSLEKGDSGSTLRAVSTYHERFRDGLFAQEIEVIRIEALAASGESGRAREAAERFSASHPKSPYADRVRSLIGRLRH
ncbi:hypothetical protein AKJ09_00908 [Labilithrix luteola]|uniref:Outer membrane lipoprotein BamD-like domain-containing protein n=1 Tax=Labilithrix luteola TaxID=1391654 RepID=A0A0K1PMC7_9BACT|nr:hypothetical protein [Labilithrix luteola]AKU94244.1 hypothetical protein AKJ09_00908 [Labilithrix luteola]